MRRKITTFFTNTQILVKFFSQNSYFAEVEVFLAEVTDDDGKEGNRHFGWCRIPAEDFDTEFEAEIVNRQVDGDDKDVAEQLPRTVQIRLRESDVFLQPEAGKKRNRENNTERGDMRCNNLFK